MNGNLRKSVSLLGLFGLLVVSLIGCSSGGSSGTPPADTSGQVRLSGTVAAGAPIAGIVNVKGANGATANTTIGLDGTYSFTEAQLAGLTKPYILFAEGNVNGKTAHLYSAGVADGTINITPITDFILRNALGSAAETAYTDWTTTADTVSATVLDTAEAKVQAQLQPVLDAAGITDVDLMSGTFTANHTGIDKVLDVVSITYDAAGTSATVTNNVTSSTFTDNVTTAVDDANALPASDTANTQNAITDETAINNIFVSLTQLYVSSRPTYSTLSTWASTHIAADFLDEGSNRDQLVSEWTIDNEGPDVGFTITTSLSSIVSNLTGSYVKGYVVSASYNIPALNESGTFETQVVYDGTKWLWYGNRNWIWPDVTSSAHKQVDSMGTKYYTGLSMYFNDDYSYAYDHGVRTVVVSIPTGSGTKNIVLNNQYPQQNFAVVSGQSVCLADSWYEHCWLSDATISQITNYNSYTVKLCSNTDAAALAANPASCTALQTYTAALGKKPILNSQLTSSLFPNLTMPAGLSVANMGWGGSTMHVTWTNGSIGPMDDVQLNWMDSQNNEMRSEDQTIRNTTRTSSYLDTLGQTTAPQWASIYMSGWDDSGIGEVQISASWSFN